MKVSILGSNGFLSSSISKYLYSLGYYIDIYGRREPQFYCFSNFYELDFFATYNIDYCQLVDSDIVIYAIGAGIQSNLKESADVIYQLNTYMPIDIFNNLKKNGFRGIYITFGSVFEMGETIEQKFFTEEDIVLSQAKASTDYVVSKRLLSRFLSSVKSDFITWHFVIPTIYGENENPLRLIPYTINCIKNGNQLNFTLGTQTRQYIYVDDISKMIKSSFEKEIPSGIYNCQGQQTLTVREIVEKIHNHYGILLSDSSFGTAQRTDSSMQYLALNGAKLRSLIGEYANTLIEDIIDKY